MYISDFFFVFLLNALQYVYRQFKRERCPVVQWHSRSRNTPSVNSEPGSEIDSGFPQRLFETPEPERVESRSSQHMTSMWLCPEFRYMQVFVECESLVLLGLVSFGRQRSPSSDPFVDPISRRQCESE